MIAIFYNIKPLISIEFCKIFHLVLRRSLVRDICQFFYMYLYILLMFLLLLVQLMHFDCQSVDIIWLL